MCEQMGEDPDWDKCPPELSDFPDIIIDALNIYNSLGERIYPDIGYVGKDFTNLNYLFTSHKIEEHLQDYVFETIMQIDSQKIQASQRKIKAQYDKIKNKK